MSESSEAHIMHMIRQLITESGRFSDVDDIDETTDLLSEGYIDSISMVTILFSLERFYQCEIPLEKISAINVSSVRSIACLIDELTVVRYA